MTPDELKDLKPGDEVLVRAIVSYGPDGEGDMFLATKANGLTQMERFFASSSAIHSLAPPLPWPWATRSTTTAMTTP